MASLASLAFERSGMHMNVGPPPPPPAEGPDDMGVKKDPPTPKPPDAVVESVSLVQQGDPMLTGLHDISKGKNKYQPKKCEHNRYGASSERACTRCGPRALSAL